MTLHDTIKEWMQKTLDIEGDFSLEYPAEAAHGDFAANAALILGKRLGKNPRELAEGFAEKLREKRISEVFDVEVAGPGFINITLDPSVFSQAVEKIISAGPTIGTHSHYSGQKVVIDYTQPNPFKEFHIGHLMNNIIGESVSRIIESTGTEIVRVTYHGDVGLHVAKAIWGIIHTGEDITVKTLGSAYATGATLFESDPEVKEEIIEINKKIYDGSDEEINRLYEKGRQVSLHYFESLYKRLSSTFNYHFFESETGPAGEKIVRDHIEKGVFELSEGAIIFRGEQYGLHTRVFISSAGLPMYEAKELGLMQIKRDLLAPFDLSITVTANEQDAFFSVTEKAVELIFPDLSGKLLHLSTGMLKLPTGKMSSRTGDVVTAEAMIESVKETAREKIKAGVLSEAQKDDIAEMVALAALRYTILRQAVGGDIIFDVEKSLSLDGDSGPYLQYATVRGKTLLKKAEGVMSRTVLDIELPRGWKTTHLERLLERYPRIVDKAAHALAPHHLVTYLTALAGEFNSYYAVHRIIDENDPTSSYKLALTRAFTDVMISGLNLLGIKVPEEM